MKEIINHVERILRNYDISFNELNEDQCNRGILEISNPAGLQRFIRRRFHKKIEMDDARELEILLLTYHYLSHN